MLTNRRVAAMLRNGRRTIRRFSARLAELSAELHFVHGFYITLTSAALVDEDRARAAVVNLCAGWGVRTCRCGTPEGFGFNFGTAE